MNRRLADVSVVEEIVATGCTTDLKDKAEDFRVRVVYLDSLAIGYNGSRNDFNMSNAVEEQPSVESHGDNENCEGVRYVENKRDFELMCAIENVNEVIAMKLELDEAMENFHRAHDEYHQTMKTLKAQEELVNYLADQEKKFLDLKEKAHRYRQRSEKISSSATDAVQSSDSICQVGLKVYEQQVRASLTGSLTGRSRTSRHSRCSTTSSVFHERIKLAADKAAMIAEVSLIRESGRLLKRSFVWRIRKNRSN